MPISLELSMIVAALLLAAGVLASQAATRLGVPALLLFLALGMLAGSDGLGGIYFDDAALAQSLGVVSLVLILFSGGLDTLWEDVRPVLKEAATLATLGVLITAVVVGLLIHKILGFALLDGLLLGAIVSSTDAAAVLAVLRSKNVSLKGRLKPLLELESGSNDPMAVFLTTSVIQLITQPYAPLSALAVRFVVQMVLGGLIGYLLGRAIPPIVNRISLGYDGLYPVLTLALVLLTYGVASLMGGNGFLAVYVAGIVAGNQEFIHRRSLLRFHDGLSWLMQIAMFLTLGLLVFPSQLPTVVGTGLIVTALLMFAGRPLAVVLCTLPFALRWRERAFLSWVGLRGAVPIILATYPLLAGLSESDVIFNVVFFVVLISTLAQGTSIPAVARWLGLDAPLPPKWDTPLEYNPVRGLKGSLREIILPPTSPAIGKAIMALRLPRTFLITLIGRGQGFIIPSGATVLQAEDRLLVIAGEEQFRLAEPILHYQDGDGSSAL